MVRSNGTWLARDLLLAGVYYTGLGWAYRVCFGRRRGIISFHNVLPQALLDDPYIRRTSITPELFERQLQYLTRSWPVQPAEKIFDPAAEGIFLTFDDGLLNNYTTVLPILERYGLTGLFALCPALMEGEVPHLWNDHLYLILRQAAGGRLLLPMDAFANPVPVTSENACQLTQSLVDWVRRERVADAAGMIRNICLRNGLEFGRFRDQPEKFHPVTWEMALDMRRRGHVIASHTWSHRILSILPAEEKRLELGRSKATLEERLGEPVGGIVYPYGKRATVDLETMELAQQVGYTHGFLNVPYPIDGPPEMGIPRFGLPRRLCRAHLHATLSGLKHGLEHMIWKT